MKKNSFHPRSILFLLCLSAVSYVSAQDQPVIAYVTIQGAKQGNFKGSSTSKGKEAQIDCVGFSYGIQSPRDAATGQASGKLQHSPIVIIKHLDGSTPQILQAASTDEVLKTVVIELYRVAGNGKNDIYETIRLTNATISKVSQYGGTSSPEKLLPNSNPYEEISFTFQKIQVENNDSKTSAADDWTTN